MTDTATLTQGSISRHLVNLTIPMFFGMSMMILAWMVESVYVGILGAAELAAVSFTFPLVMGLSSISMGVGTGASSLIARYMGAGDRARAEILTTHCMLLVLLMSVALTAIGYLFLDSFFTLLGADPALLPLIRKYMVVWLLGLPFFSIPMVASNVLRAVGNAKVPGYIISGSSLIQMLIAPILIFGLLGAPRLELMGSSLTFVISGVLRLLAMFYLLIVTEKLMRFRHPALNELFQSWKEILRIGLPSMLSSLIGPTSLAVILSLLAVHGSDVVAGFGVASRIDMLATMLLMSLSSSVGPFIGQNWGARQVDRVRKALRLSYQFSLFWGLICFLLLAPFGSWILSQFNENTTVIESGALYLWIVPISYGFMGIGSMAGACFVALGKPLPNLIMSILRMAVVYIPMAMLGNYLMGFPGIFVATALANFIMGGVAWIWNRSMLRQEVRKLGIDDTGHDP